MGKLKTSCGLAALIVTFAATSASALLPPRTWVSGVGDDANPCSRTAPCKTFAGAFAKTEVGGDRPVHDRRRAAAPFQLERGVQRDGRERDGELVHQQPVQRQRSGGHDHADRRADEPDRPAIASSCSDPSALARRTRGGRVALWRPVAIRPAATLVGIVSQPATQRPLTVTRVAGPADTHHRFY